MDYKFFVHEDEYSGVMVFLVDGRYVRENMSEEFIGGGHHYVYDFIPLMEVWLEDTTRSDEVEFYLVHELRERRLMATGIDYITAHDEANNLEFMLRDNIEMVSEVLKMEFESQGRRGIGTFATSEAEQLLLEQAIARIEKTYLYLEPKRNDPTISPEIKSKIEDILFKGDSLLKILSDDEVNESDKVDALQEYLALPFIFGEYTLTIRLFAEGDDSLDTQDFYDEFENSPIIYTGKLESMQEVYRTTISQLEKRVAYDLYVSDPGDAHTGSRNPTYLGSYPFSVVGDEFAAYVVYIFKNDDSEFDDEERKTISAIKYYIMSHAFTLPDLKHRERA
jgi:hypothetical protein